MKQITKGLQAPACGLRQKPVGGKFELCTRLLDVWAVAINAEFAPQ